MAWYPDGVPDWLTEEELMAAQFNIDSSHKPFLTVAQLNEALKETTEEFYTRNSDILKKITDVTSEYPFILKSMDGNFSMEWEIFLGGNVLVVAHATTLDTCTRQMIGETPRNTNELRQVIHKIPYCSLATIEQDSEGRWKFVEPECLPVTHSKNPRFEWNALTAT